MSSKALLRIFLKKKLRFDGKSGVLTTLFKAYAPQIPLTTPYQSI